jgi:class 3 adenylate cyclase
MPVVIDSHLQAAWQAPEVRYLAELMSEQQQLVLYDSRGTGLSDRDISAYSIDALLLDLEAVTQQLHVGRFALFAGPWIGPAAISYAATKPHRVSHLILYNSWARTRDAGSAQARGLARLLDVDWELYTDTIARWAGSWSEGEVTRRLAERYREGVTQETWKAFVRAMVNIDVTELLPQIETPTLVLQRRQSRIGGENLARALASQIPGARLVLLEGDNPAPYVDPEQVVRAVNEFLHEGDRAQPRPNAASPPELTSAAPAVGLVTILFTDLAASTALTQRLGDARAQELLRAHNAIVREALSAHGGSEIKHTGDGIMASFPTASGALDCAVAIQRAVAQQDNDDLQVHVGLNAGEPVAEDEDLFGTAVQLARRICDEAEGGEVLASNVVRELSAGKGFLFADRGAAALKGFEDPVRLYEVRWRAEGSPDEPGP